MRLHPASDPQDQNGDLGTGGIADFLPPAFGLLTGQSNVTSSLGAPPLVSAPPLASTPLAPILPDESVQAMAAVSGSGSGGVGSVVAETSSSGFTVNLVFDAAAMAAPASFRTGIEQAAAILSETITNKITVNLDIDYSGTGGGAAAGPDNGQYVNYSTVRADLIANAAPGDTSFNALPTGSTIQGQSQVAVWNAQLKLFGLISPNSTTTDDGSATFATDINSNLLVGVALHELTHAIGRVPYGSEPDIFDFYRFTSPGTRLFTDNIPASSAYFSLDGGNTKLADFGVSSDPSDFLNAPNSNLTPTDAFDEFYSNNTLQSLTPVDLQVLDALGFNTTPLGIVVVANAAEALQGGSAVSLLGSAPNINDPGSTTLSSATIKIANASGNAVAGDKLFVDGIENGSLGSSGVTASWNATTDTLTLSGTASIATYDTLLNEITFQDTGTDASSGSHPVRTVTWTINDGTNSYNATSTIDIDRGPAAANNIATDAVGTTLSTTAASGVLANASDLDGDSLTVTAVSDTAHGVGTIGSALAGLYGHLALNANGSYSYIADNTAAVSSAPTGSHLQDAFTYTVSDGNGGTTTASLTVTLDRPPVVTASNVTLSTGHTTVAASSLFSVADPDGNAITTCAFEDTGSGHFLLNGVVEPNNQEIDVSAAQLSQLTYQSVAGSVDTLEVRVNDGTLWSNWQSFAATPAVVIQTDGTTALTEVGNNFFLNNTGTGTGPELKQGGVAVTSGEFGTWTPIGAVQVTGGYDVAWHDTSSGLYTVWSTDSNGNYLSDFILPVSGNSSSIESIETIFNQDLNGDGHIGIPSVVVQTDGTTALTDVGNNFFLNNTGTGAGPELKQGGVAVTSGEFGTWTPIGAVQVTGGYDVAWHDTSSGLYTVWSTDSNGNYLSDFILPVSGNSSSIESIETIFNQDLNGDGHIGIVSVVVQTDGSTALTDVGNNFFLNNTGTGAGPELKQGGVAVTSGEFGTWTPIGAVQVTGGYDVAWHDTSSGLYTVWSTDTNGNYLSDFILPVSGNSSSIESIETIFNQDLNGDGHIGIVSVVVQTDGTTALTDVGNNFFLNNTGTGTGPELKQGGVAVTSGEFGTWMPIGAVQVTGGYDVAWHDTSSGLYTVWSTDSNGNYLSDFILPVSGNSSSIESIETIFNQDLNGDGHIGIPSVVVQTDGTTALTDVGNNFFLNNTGTGAGPELKQGGVAVTSGEFGTWTPIGAVQVTGGYDVAWHDTSSGLYTVWSTDSNGNYLSDFILPVSGNSSSIESIETIFNQDLNGDGHIGIPRATQPAATASVQSNSLPKNFQFANASGPTIQNSTMDQTATPANNAVAIAGHDVFVFAPNFGQANIANFSPTTDTIEFSKSVLADIRAMLEGTHDDASGNAVISDAAHDTITIKQITTAQLLAHQSDFHFV